MTFSQINNTLFAWNGNNIVDNLKTVQGPVKYLSSNGLFFTFPFAEKYTKNTLKLLRSASEYSSNYDKYYYNNGENRITIYPCYLGPASGRIDAGFVSEYGFSYVHPFAIHTLSGLNWTYWDGNTPWDASVVSLESKWEAHGIDMRYPTVSVGLPPSISVSSRYCVVDISSWGNNLRSIYFKYGDDNDAPIIFYGDIFNISQTVTGGYTFNCYDSGYHHIVSTNRTVYIS